MALIDIERLSPHHRAHIASQQKLSESAKKPRKAPKPELLAYGEVFDSKLEVDFAGELERWRREDLIADWRYHPVRFRLARNVTYTPDFLTVRTASPLVITMYEVKGSWKQKGARDSRTRLQIAAYQFQWFSWYGVTRDRDVWNFEQIHASAAEGET